MSFPVYVSFGSLRLHPHLVFETLAYAMAFRVYLWLRNHRGDALDDGNRWWVIAAAAMGAVFGSKILYWFEDPRATLAHWRDPAYLMGGKTIVGALIGGLFAVELVKHHFGIKRRTGDLFAIPLCLGIAIGRIGCFLTGLDDHTAGIATALPWGVNFGDGIPRHPTQLYEVLFALTLGVFLWRQSRNPHVEGDVFKQFMVAYFFFRLFCDFIKPDDVRIFLGLTSIQLACITILAYYSSDGARWIRSIPIWDVQTGALFQSFSAHSEPVLAAEFSPDSQRLASASANFAPLSRHGSLKFWDAITAREIPAPPFHFAISAIAFRSDGRALALAYFGSDHNWDIDILDLRDRRLLRHFVAHRRRIAQLAFSPDGYWLVSVSADKFIRCWR